MLRSQVTLVALLLASLFVAAPWDAHAIHKSWVLKNSGSECAFTTPNSTNDNVHGYSLYNGANSTRSATCPVSLAGRWGSSSPATTIKRWSAAWAANIYVLNNKPGTTFSCSVRSKLKDGGYFYSRTASTTLGGDRRLTPAYAGGWGGTLEAVDESEISAMDFSCNVPGNYSGIYGYKVRICQKTAATGSDCYDNNAENHGDYAIAQKDDGSNWVQTSGIECKGDSLDIIRGFEGIKNEGTDWNGVSCPLVPPAEDSAESNRDIYRVEVYFKTPQAGAFPTCQLTWRDRDQPGLATGTDKWSSAFTYESAYKRVVLNTKFIGLDMGVAVFCDTPAGMTIQGVTAKFGVAPVSGGG